MAHWFEMLVVASNEDAFYKCFDAATHDDPDPETSYEKWYGPLEERIARVLDSHGVPREATDYFANWVPNRTRHVTIERRYLTPRIINALHDLLTGDYQFWRIDVLIVNSITEDDRVGQIGMWKDWVLCWGCGRDLLPTRREPHD